MEAERGSVLIGDSGQLFRIIGEENKKLWSGQLNPSECIKAIGIVDGLPSIVYLLKKDLKFYRNITEEIESINTMFREINNGEDANFLESETENKELRLNLKNARKKLEELKVFFGLAQKSIEEKDNIINAFQGSPEDIRKSQNGSSVEDIRNAFKNRGKV